MRILLINHYAGTPELGMEYRPYYIAREWINDGHEVTIIAASFSHVRSKQPYVKKSFEEQVIDGIRYIWVKTPHYHGNGMKRFINILVFVFKIISKLRVIAKRYNPDVVIASSTYPLDNFPAYRISRKCNAQYAYEVHDLWPLSPMELGGMSKYHPFILLMKNAEIFAYKRVDKVISMLPLTLEYMTENGLDPSKWHYIPNGINIQEWKNSETLPEDISKKISEIKNRGNLIISYAGSIGVANALDNFLDAAYGMKDKKITFLIAGDGPEKKRLIKRAEEERLDNVLFIDPLPRRAIPKLLERCDILYIGLQKQPLFRFGISPNKLLDYMMAAKPVIQAIEAGNDITGDANCGFSIKPENPDELVKTINKMFKLTETERERLGQNGRKYVIRNHNYEILAGKMIKIFNE